MGKRLLRAVFRSLIFLFALSYLIINVPDVHVKLLLSQTRKAVFFASPTYNPNTGGTAFQLNTPQGLRIITNAHVCQLFSLNKTALLHTYDGKTFQRKVLKISKTTDLCMLKGIKGYPSLEMGSEIRIFDKVRVIGHPLAGPFSLAQGYSIGKEEIELPVRLPLEQCKGKGYKIKHYWMGPLCIKTEEAVHVTAKIYPGNSGSPVINFWGRVTGVAFAADTRSHHGFIIPFEKLVEFIR